MLSGYHSRPKAMKHTYTGNRLNMKEYCESCGGLLSSDGVCEYCLSDDYFEESEEYLDGFDLPIQDD